MIIVTGGAGFIGSNIVRLLNEKGLENIVIIDDLSDAMKVKNLSDLKIDDYLDRKEFSHELRRKGIPKGVRAVLHQGACSDTMATDGQEVMETNYTFSKLLLDACVSAGTQLIYASSAAIYGASSSFSVDPEDELPLNIYAYSKHLFDRLVRKTLKSSDPKVVGLRYFNVYGPREGHKGRMASVVYQMFQQLEIKGCIRLFKGSGGFDDGEQRRDFIYVKDVANVNLYMLENTETRGIINVGTGKSRSFNDVALAVVNAHRVGNDQTEVSLGEAQELDIISYHSMPDELEGKYQSFTEANLDTLNEAGFSHRMTELEDGVRDYVSYLRSH